MATSPITTSGFTVQERPGINYLPPSAFAPQYGNIIPSLSQGLGVASQFAQIADDVQARPLRRQLQQIQLDEAKARLAMLPLQQQLQALQLGEAQQQAALPEQIIEGVEVVGGEPGPAEFYDVFTPRERITRGKNVLAGGLVSPFEKRETLATPAQVAADAEKQAVALESARALAAQRGRGKAFESTQLIELYNNAVEEGDADAAALYKSRIDALNTRKPALTAEDFYDRRVAQQAADAGITYDVALKLSRTPSGAEALAAAAVANKAAAQSGFMAPQVTPAQRALITGGAPAAAPSARGPLNTDAILGGGDIEVPTLTVQEAAAAAPGTIFIGTDGKRRQKNANGTVSIIQ
jgi:hypothetical protein